jgi:hypothetical protein
MKHTNLLNEIKGNYTKADFWFDAIIIGIAVTVIFGVLLVAFEALGGADLLLEAVEIM